MIDNHMGGPEMTPQPPPARHAAAQPWRASTARQASRAFSRDAQILGAVDA